MKNYVRSQFCKTPEECAFAIEKFRLSLTPEKCQNYINKLNEVYLINLYLKNKITYNKYKCIIFKGNRYSNSS